MFGAGQDVGTKQPARTDMDRPNLFKRAWRGLAEMF
jgi:hypothetical protein